jgi:hypothetical protein
MLLRTLVLALLFIAALPAPGRAVTLDDVVALSRQGVDASIVIAVIDADRTVFSLTPDQVVALKKQGVADAVIVKMLGTAREFAQPAPPSLVIVGEQAPAPVAEPLPTIVTIPYFVAIPGRGHHDHRPPRLAPPPVTPQPRPGDGGFGRFMNDGWVDGIGFGRFITH